MGSVFGFRRSDSDLIVSHIVLSLSPDLDHYNKYERSSIGHQFYGGGEGGQTVDHPESKPLA